MVKWGSLAVARRAALLALALAGQVSLFAVGAPAAPLQEKDQSRLLPGAEEGGKLQDKLLPSVPLAPEGEEDAAPEAEAVPPADVEELDLEALIAEDVPDIEAVDFSLDEARRALLVLEEIYGKFDDAEIEKYPTLQEFAEKSPQGAKLKEITKKHGFDSVARWSRVIANIGFAYTSLQEGDEELLRQLERIRADDKMDKERKQRLLKYYDALIPSDNNRKVLNQLMEQEEWRRRLELLEGHEE